MISRIINWFFSLFAKKNTSDAILEEKVKKYQADIDKIDEEIKEVNKKDHSLDDNIKFFNRK